VRRLYDATVGRFFTAWYGFMMRLVDETGLREVRRSVLAQASGRTLDIGSGTGSNIPLYTERVEELVLAEPDPHMQRALRRRLDEEGRTGIELVQARAEQLPFPDSSFDYVACTMVLCTVPDPAAA
jgi:ubiquinone/menaquinone biosynthesis C-methylase UbiE